jgi:hypothetical protein
LLCFASSLEGDDGYDDDDDELALDKRDERAKQTWMAWHGISYI